jgi:DNA-binding response OmpR family regulator
MSARILIVDDDAAVLRTLTSAMRRGGFTAVSASNTAEALVAGEPLDAALVDYHIGTESGLDVVRALRERYGHHVFIIMLTGEDDEDTRHAAAEAGADLVLGKPVSPSELRGHLGRGLEIIRTAA